MNFCKRSYQPILRYLYTEVTKRRSEISLHKHFKCETWRKTVGNLTVLVSRTKTLNFSFEDGRKNATKLFSKRIQRFFIAFQKGSVFSIFWFFSEGCGSYPEPLEFSFKMLKLSERLREYGELVRNSYLVMRGNVKRHNSLKKNFRCFMIWKKRISIHIISMYVKKNWLEEEHVYSSHRLRSGPKISFGHRHLSDSGR